MRYPVTLICALLVFSVFNCRAAKVNTFDEYFKGHNGTFVIRELNSNETQIHNRDLANQKLPPQSTFKVPNALIGLQTGVVSGKDHLKKWDGQIRSYSAHNRDHNLASAIQYSVLWYFQDIARDVGTYRMQEWINQVGYGNRDISGGIDCFWLESSLRISPIEQVDFMEKLYKEDLPFDKTVIQTVKKMIILKQDETFVLAGKTGTRNNLGGGWFVGYMSYREKTYAFATYIDGPDASGSKAREITENIIYGELIK